MSHRKTIFQTDLPELLHFMENLPEIFSKEGTIIKDDRNKIKIIKYNNLELCVKAFNKMTSFNRIMYSWFRSTKAERSYIAAKKLLKKGIDTPKPMGYAETKGKWGILKQSFYVSVYLKYEWMLADAVIGGIPDENKILSDFARFMATKTHPAGIWHKDLSASNILITRTKGNHYAFSVIDINRISFKKHISPQKGIRNLQKLSRRPTIMTLFAEEYAKATDQNPIKLAFHLFDSQLKFTNSRKRTKRILGYFKPKKMLSKESLSLLP